MFVSFSLSLSYTQYTEEIEQQFENTDITLPDFTFLTPEDKNQLSSFSTKAKNADFNSVTQQVGIV